MKVHHRERAQGVHALLVAFLDWWEVNGPFEVTVVNQGGLRSQRVVSELYAQGRTQPGPPCRCTPRPCMKHPLGLTVSNARLAAETAHGRAGALDLAPWVDGEIPWQKWDLFEVVGQFGEEHGLEWGGRWPERKDGPHLQVPNWRELPFPGVSHSG